MPHYVYILECENGSFYTGYTTNVERRYLEHQNGSIKCRYTRSFPPKRLVANWELESRSLALRVEARIKKLSRCDKEELLDVDTITLIKKLSLELL